MSQQLMVRFLEGLCEVRVAPSLAAGWSAIHAEAYDLVIADYLYPEGDLLVFLHQAREIYDPMVLPIIVTSGSLDRQMISQSMRMGANDCIQKPLRRNDVREMVEKMLDQPYIRKSDSDLAVSMTLEWSLDGRFYQYAPELNLRVEGRSPDEASTKMRSLLQAELAKGTHLGYLITCKVVTHLVEPPSPLTTEIPPQSS